MLTSDPLLSLALILVTGLVSGQLASRIGLPSVTGQILAGIALGPTVSGLFHHEQLLALQPITHFALGLIAVTIGGHLHISRIRVAKRRLLLLLLCESVVTPLIVGTTILLLFDVQLIVAAMLAALAVSTAPATVVALVREARAKGVFVRTLMAAVALNNIACLCLFEIAHSAGRSVLSNGTASWTDLVSSPLIALLGSAALGTGIGLALILATRKVVRSDHLAAASMVAILLTVGAGNHFGLSSLLACLALGLTLANITPDKEEIGDRVFEKFENAILAVFFTLAGAELDFGYLVPAGLLASALVVSRVAGKLASARLSMALAGAPKNVQRYLGWALVPQAGLAIGLLLSVQNDPAFESLRSLLLAVGLTSVLANELIGPITTRIALVRSGEVGKDRARLIDFLQEENITTDLQARTLDDALAELTQLLWNTHRLDPSLREGFLESVRRREREMSSYLGEGLAIPHGEMERGNSIVGVMGISHVGIPVEHSHDSLHCIVLLATPRSLRDRHLEVLAAFARAIGGDRNIRHQLYEAQSPAHAYQLLHAEESESFNYFIDEEARPGR
jgi:Kef-type K+ transport system membrane component KefB/mannitol/fructose-specific phosphotransferase system IIA component